MFIIFLIQAIHSFDPENFLCGLRLFYDEKTFFLIDQQNENTMPYIQTCQSPHFALDIQQTYKSSPSLNNNSYFLVGFSDAYIFAGDASEIQWLSIQEFKVKQNRTTVSIHKYNGYNGYFVDKEEDGGHLLISKENLIRDFSYGKTDAVDKFEKMGFVYIISWGGKGDALQILKRFVHLIDQSEGQEYCQKKVALISLEQIKCNLDLNFEHLTFHTPDLYHPPIHYHMGNQIINGSLDNEYFTKNYPGLQVFVAQNLNNKVLELRIPIKNMETHQQTIEYPLSGLIVTIQQENRGFIHIIIFESDEGVVINYKEDQNLAYITIGMTDSKVFVFSFVTSQFTKFPSIDLIQHVFQDCVFIIQQRNNVCENIQQSCSDVSLNISKQLQFELDSDQLIKFKSNGEYQDTPFVKIFDNIIEIQNEFNVLFSSEMKNREMNHGGYIGSFLRITYKNQSINSLIINEQNENLELFYSINDNIYSHSVQNIIGQTYVLVFTSQNELSDNQCLQLFREFIDHIQKIFIIEQIENHCEAQQRYYDVKPIQYKEIHKLLKQSAELIQTVNQDQFDQNDLEYSIDEDESIQKSLKTNSEQLGFVSEVSIIPEEIHLETQSNENLKENQNLETQDLFQKENFDNENYKQKQEIQEQTKQFNNLKNQQIYQSKKEEFDQNEKSKQNLKHLQSKQKNLKSQLNNQQRSKMEQKDKEFRSRQNEQQNIEQEDQTQKREQQLQIEQNEQYQNTFHQRDQYYDKGDRYLNQQYQGRDYQRREDYYGRDDYYNRYSSRRGPPLTGQSVVIPKNPNDQELGRFLRDVISKLYIYSDPCDAKSTNYNPDNCEVDNYYGSSSIKRTEPRQRDFYRSAYKYDNRYEYRACITVYSKCYFKGESLQLCGHQRNIPKSQLYLDILSIRADENYIVEFYMRGRDGRSELYTLKGTQKCLKSPLRVDWLLQ
ncbi:unnamed protein product [Paramecium primaurelia]|uniref:Uncharacterized protein n=1 Tax=Paramecium primaurelia TaxID=5886 RepID=A0A8S1JZE5_PARPR|nr:unnamed protein product [Paramecium primaurelia]